MRSLAILYACLAALPQLAPAQGWHRMGGMPDMPVEMLKPPEGEPHHLRYHKEGPEPIKTFAFGQPGDGDRAARTIHIEARDDAGYAGLSLQVHPNETVRFFVHNPGSTPHEFRIGDPDYQRAHQAMVARMPGTQHDDPNAIVVAPGETGWIVWKFGNTPIVQLACHLGAQYRTGHYATVHVIE
jgi:uncharacterized cupredoxin-like copper-binding protein